MSISRYQTEAPPYKPLAITAIVFSVLLAPIGIILAVIARVLQRRAGYVPDVLTTVALVLGVLFLLLGIVLFMSFLVGFSTILPELGIQ